MGKDRWFRLAKVTSHSLQLLMELNSGPRLVSKLPEGFDKKNLDQLVKAGFAKIEGEVVDVTEEGKMTEDPAYVWYVLVKNLPPPRLRDLSRWHWRQLNLLKWRLQRRTIIKVRGVLDEPED